MILKIKGKPKPKQSVRGGKGFFYKDPKIKEKEEDIKRQIKEQLPKDFEIITEAIKINRLTYIFPIPKTNKKIQKAINEGKTVYRPKVPDLTDNLNKMLFDSMEDVFENDKQIVMMNNVIKIYGEEPGIILDLEIMPENEICL
ncbi:MAG: RusA family crossover junction endodeoxyribonuclease [Mycoplasma sp.]|nr:RusA family crossover junction endodeoxyribonuclease [Mycoplasma sp.]